MTVLKPVRSVADAGVRRGDVIRWGTDGRWALVVETELDSPQGELARMVWCFGRDAGGYVSDPANGMVEGWELLRTNRHSIYRLRGTHTAKHRADATMDAAKVLGADGHKLYAEG